MNKTVSGLVFIAVGISFLIISLLSDDGKSKLTALWPDQLKQIERAPDFTLPTLQNPEESVTLSEFSRDQNVMLIFWATWCPSCVEEIEQLNEWMETYDGKFKILAVNVKESREDVLNFEKKHAMHYTVVMDHQGEVSERYGIAALPVSLFLAKGGEIIYYGFGLPARVDQLLTQD